MEVVIESPKFIGPSLELAMSGKNRRLVADEPVEFEK